MTNKDNTVGEEIDKIGETILMYGLDVGKTCKIISFDDLPQSISYEEKFRLSSRAIAGQFRDRIERLLDQKVKEARIDTYKEIAQLFCGIPTKTLKRADLKDYLSHIINQLTTKEE